MKYFNDKLIQPIRSRKGVALVTVLWMAMLMSVLVTLAARGSLLDTKISLLEVEKQRCRWAARAGLETAYAILDEDERSYDSLDDLWSDNPDQLEAIELERCRVDVTVVDAASKLNLNTVTREQLLSLPDMTEEIADSILDWRDEDDQIRESGAEDGYYQNLEYPYRVKNAGFKSVRELLMVRGVNENLLYGTSEGMYLSPDNEGWIHYLTAYSQEYNRDSLGTSKVNLNQADENTLTGQLSLSAAHARWITQNRPFNQWSAVLGGNNQQRGQNRGNNRQRQNNQRQQNNNRNNGQSNGQNQNNNQGNDNNQGEPLDMNALLSIIDDSTISDQEYIPGKVNVNTAGLIVLAALMEDNLTMAENILAYRLGLDGGFSSLSDLQNVEGMTEDMLKTLLDRATVRSCVFEVYSVGVSQSTALRYEIEAVVNREQQSAGVIYWHEGISK